MSALVRTAVGIFTLDRAVELDEITERRLPELIQDPLVALDRRRRVILDPAELARVAKGQTVRRLLAAATTEERGDEVLALDPAGRLVAILECVGPSADHWHPRLTFFAGS